MKKFIFCYKAFIIISLIIHFYIKDTFFWSSIIFYALPLPILIVLLLIIAFMLKNRLRKVSVFLSLLLIFVWCNRSYLSNQEESKKAGLEIVFWNASHDKNFEDAFIVNKGLPDILVIVEYDEEKSKKINSIHPNYHSYLSKEGIGLFSKTPIKYHNEETSVNNSTVLKFETKGLTFFVVDVSASVFNFRKNELKFVNSKIDSWTNSIVLGDFNTPFESKYFKDINIKYKNAFSESGNGFRETWFWNLPILSLDHIFISEDLKSVKTEKINTFKSDHSMLRTIISQ